MFLDTRGNSFFWNFGGFLWHDRNFHEALFSIKILRKSNDISKSFARYLRKHCRTKHETPSIAGEFIEF
jgi:hypothetical protein